MHLAPLILMRHRYFARRGSVPKAICAALALTLAFETGVGAQEAASDQPVLTQARTASNDAELKKALAAIVAASPLKDHVSIRVIDLVTGQSVASVDDGRPRNPASNMKLLTAAAAMRELGPDFRIRTGMYGKIEGRNVTGGLCLKGNGDPTLDSSDLVVFAQRLVDEGVRSVDEVVIDGTYFDAQVLPPSFEEQPNEIAPFRAAVAALSVNENAYTLRVRPGPTEGAATSVSIDGSGYFEIDNGMTTSAGGTANVIAAQRGPGEKLTLTLRGSIPIGSSSMAFARRVESPMHYAGHAFIDALRALRIQVPKRVVIGACPSDARLIASHVSQPLGEILSRLGKESDNFVAEMVLKVLGAERKRKPGRSADGVIVVLDTLKRMGIKTDGIAMVNGSGLFHGNQVSAAHFAALLSAMHRDPSLRDDFIAHLAVGGVDGTLARRFRNLPAPRIVRAKTGTLDDVIALSGYVLGPTPSQAFAFSYLANGVSGKHGEARQLIDELVEALAAYLYAKR